MEVQVEGVCGEQEGELGAKDDACCREEGEGEDLAISTRTGSGTAASQGEKVASCQGC